MLLKNCSVWYYLGLFLLWCWDEFLKEENSQVLWHLLLERILGWFDSLFEQEWCFMGPYKNWWPLSHLYLMKSGGALVMFSITFSASFNLPLSWAEIGPRPAESQLENTPDRLAAKSHNRDWRFCWLGWNCVLNSLPLLLFGEEWGKRCRDCLCAGVICIC